MRLCRTFVILWIAINYSSVLARAQEVPPPPAAPVTPDSPALPVQSQLQADLQIVNSCFCPIIMRASRTIDNFWPADVTAQKDTIGHISLSGSGPFDVLLQQYEDSYTINAFRYDGINYPLWASLSPPTVVNLPFHAVYQQKWNGNSWVSIPLPPGPTAKIQMLVGDGRAMLIVPMLIRADPVTPPVIPRNPRPR